MLHILSLCYELHYRLWWNNCYSMFICAMPLTVTAIYKIHWHWTMYNFLEYISPICWLIALRYVILGIIKIKPPVKCMRFHTWCRLSCTQRFSACNIEDLTFSSCSRPASTKYAMNVLDRPYLLCFHCISFLHSSSTNPRRTNSDSSCKRK